MGKDTESRSNLYRHIRQYQTIRSGKTPTDLHPYCVSDARRYVLAPADADPRWQLICGFSRQGTGLHQGGYKICLNKKHPLPTRLHRNVGFCASGLPCCANYFFRKRSPSHYRHTHSDPAPWGELVYYESVHPVQFRLLCSLGPFDVQSIHQVLPHAINIRIMI
jgi:hypothetical protein